MPKKLDMREIGRIIKWKVKENIITVMEISNVFIYNQIISYSGDWLCNLKHGKGFFS
jgi:hypothetical protein